MSTPVVFISYSHDSTEHSDWVERLATDLRRRGVDVLLDVWELQLGQDIGAFMYKSIAAANRVLLVCSDTYVQKADAGSGGVGYESLIVTGEVVQSIDTRKFIPIIRNCKGPSRLPKFLGHRLWLDFEHDAAYYSSLESLARELLGTPAKPKPPLGANPYAEEGTAASLPERAAGPTGLLPSGLPVLDDHWHTKELATAQAGLGSLGLIGAMELRFAPHAPLLKSQVELLTAVRASQIETFGWPIGIVAENKGEFAPRPFTGGIRAEISIKKDQLYGRESYDYWALRTSGDFVLLQSLFEDMRAEGQIFFNTRIVRVTEALLFAEKLYSELGAGTSTGISIRVAHQGLKNRTLSSAGPRRYIRSRVCHEERSQTEIAVTLSDIRPNLPTHVRRLLEPMFMLFEFADFKHAIYEDIARKFEAGQLT